MSEEKDPAAGASGMLYSEEEKNPGAPAAVEDKPKKAAVEDKPKRGRPKKSPLSNAEKEALEKRVEELEMRIAANTPTLKHCHMCHKGGATIQRGNTGEWFHKPCLQDYRKGKDPIPTE